MLDKKDLEDIWVEVQENSRKLASCSLHNFSIDLTTDRKFDKKYLCVNCSGTVDTITKHWYEKGLTHARELLKEDIELANMYRGLCK